MQAFSLPFNVEILQLLISASVKRATVTILQHSNQTVRQACDFVF